MKNDKTHLVELVIFKETDIFLSKIGWTLPGIRFFYYGMIGLIALALVFIIFKNSLFESNVLLQICLGLASMLLVIPIHEAIHFLSFKALGAKNVRLIPNVKRGTILTVAHQFEINRRIAFWVFLMPFFVITSTCLISIGFVSLDYKLTLLSALFVHTMICSADFQLWSYLKSNASYSLIGNSTERSFSIYTSHPTD